MPVRNECGAAAAFVVLFALALLAVAGLVIDGGYALGAHRRAMNGAEQAARIGADSLSESALRDGDIRVDPVAARASAEAYLRSAGLQGSVVVRGAEVTVTVRVQQRTALLSAVGVDSLHIRESATATSVDDNP